MMNRDLVRVDFTLYGSFARTYRGTRKQTGRFWAGSWASPQMTAGFRIPFPSQKNGDWSTSFTVNDRETEIHPNTVDIRMEDSEGHVLTVRGRIHRRRRKVRHPPRIESGRGGLSSGEYSTLIVVQQDKPGVVAHITRCLSEKNVNIAYMKLYREEKGSTAYSIVESDDLLPDEAIQRIRENRYVRDVMLIQTQKEA